MTVSYEGCYLLGVSATMRHAQDRFLHESSRSDSHCIIECPVDSVHEIPSTSERGYRVYYKDKAALGLHDGWEERT